MLGVLAPALRRHIGHRALEDLEQRLLHALARYVTRDRRVAPRLARYLVDLVDIDDPLFSPRDVIVSGLDQAQQDVLHILADVTGLGQGRGIRDRKRHVEKAGQRLREQGLAATGRTDEHDIALGQFHVVGTGLGRDPLVVVVHRYREHALGVGLADDVLVEVLGDLARRGQPFELERLTLLRAELLFDQDLIAQVDALVADEHAPGASDQLFDLVAAAITE